MNDRQAISQPYPLWGSWTEKGERRWGRIVGWLVQSYGEAFPIIAADDSAWGQTVGPEIVVELHDSADDAESATHVSIAGAR